MTLSAIAVPSVAMRDASHGGTRPPWSGRSAMPERFIRSFSHPSEVSGCRRRPHWLSAAARDRIRETARGDWLRLRLDLGSIRLDRDLAVADQERIAGK